MAEPAPAAPAAEMPAPVVETPPAPPEAAKPPEFKITTGVGLRFGAQLEGLREGTKLNQVSVDEVYAEPRFSGQVLGFVGWTANLAVQGISHNTVINMAGAPPPEGSPTAFEARAMDLVAQLDFMDEFHVWGGRMLTPSDRSNFSGPWFMSPWDYPGVYAVPGRRGGFVYVGPRGTEEIGREVGTTVWGDIGKGKFKYYVAALDLDDAPQNTPLYSARVSYDFIGNEPGFYGSSTYYGAQDVLALGAAVQYQDRFAPPNNGWAASDDVFEFNADLLAEFNIGTSGTITGEGAYYHADSGKSGKVVGVMPFDNAWFVVGSYLTPPVGPGKIQPLIRYQGYQDKRKGLPDGEGTIIDAEVNYVMKDYFAKLSLGYQYTLLKHATIGAGRGVGDAIQFGFQIQQ